jgi:hypothetical protein
LVGRRHEILPDVTAPARGVPERFVLERKIGSGGFGAVYVAYDRERQVRLALKTLIRAGASAAYRFKHEFRALAGVAHPNLVRLHELYAHGEDWCFTMDLVSGVHFDRYVRGEGGGGSGQHLLASTHVGGTPELAAPAGRAPDSSTGTITLDANLGPVLDERRLRTALAGLASGVLALHAAGILHRDLKPSNVLVRPDGRTAILDFGLAASGVVDTHESMELVGTPAYMSPEQAQGRPLSTASDWYAVGVMLYEALCNHLPFSGTTPDLLAARVQRDPRDPRTMFKRLPEDLCELCMELLRRDPAARPSGAEIAARLGLEAHASALTDAARRAPFVGRREELGALSAAFEQVQAGTPMVVEVRAPSGVGKSALIRRFLEDQRGAAVVLEGRCYEREYVPYKAFDGIVDALTRTLQRLPRVEAAALLPRGVREVARLFPALGRLEVLQAVPEREPAPDAHAARQRAFAALRELFAQLGDRTEVILFIDDAHWADADSAALLFELLRPPEPPRLLLIVATRGAGEPTGNDVLRVLQAARPEGAAHRSVHLELRPLTEADAEALARAYVDGDGPEASKRAAAVARESGGSPLFIRELARTVSHGGATGDEVSLQGLLVDRIGTLDPAARAVLGLLACAIRPLGEEILRQAAGQGVPEAHEAIRRLHEGGFIHSVQVRDQSLVEILHERVRAAALATLEPGERTRSCLRLAETLEAVPEADLETLAQLFAAAGEPGRAAPHAERAGDRASAALAFAQAVDLYMVALDGTGRDNRLRVLEKLADALAHAGRGRDAAFIYVEAARLRDDDQGSVLRERAAIQLLRAGHIEAGLDVLRPVAESLGLALPPTPGRALTNLLWNRARIKLRGPLMRARRSEGDVPPRQLRRIDLCWALGNGLVGVDLVRAAGYQARHVLLASEAGEPYRISCALAKEAVLSALENQAGILRAGALLAQAEVLAREVGHPHALAWVVTASAVKAWAECRLAACAELCEKAVALFHERCADIFYEVGSVEVWFNLHVQFLLGRIETVARRVSSCVREAEARGDLYTLTTARAYVRPTLWLAQDRPEDARREADEAIAQWGTSAWHHQHWAGLRADCHVDLYEGAGARLLERVATHLPSMKRTKQLRLRAPRIEVTYLEGRGALETVRTTPARRRELLPVAERVARALDGESSLWASAHAAALRAGIAALGDDGRRSSSPALFERARVAYESLEMPLYAAACAASRGQLLGGDEGAALRAAARQRMEAAGVKHPERFAAFLVPTPGGTG